MLQKQAIHVAVLHHHNILSAKELKQQRLYNTITQRVLFAIDAALFRLNHATRLESLKRERSEQQQKLLTLSLMKETENSETKLSSELEQVRKALKEQTDQISSLKAQNDKFIKEKKAESFENNISKNVKTVIDSALEKQRKSFLKRAQRKKFLRMLEKSKELANKNTQSLQKMFLKAFEKLSKSVDDSKDEKIKNELRESKKSLFERERRNKEKLEGEMRRREERLKRQQERQIDQQNHFNENLLREQKELTISLANKQNEIFNTLSVEQRRFKDKIDSQENTFEQKVTTQQKVDEKNSKETFQRFSDQEKSETNKKNLIELIVGLTAKLGGKFEQELKGLQSSIEKKDVSHSQLQRFAKYLKRSLRRRMMRNNRRNGRKERKEREKERRKRLRRSFQRRLEANLERKLNKKEKRFLQNEKKK